MTINTSVSGIQAAFTRLDVSANNVANVNTPGYNQVNAVQTETPGGGTAITSLAQTNQPTDLAKQAGELIISKNSSAANIAVLKVQNEMMGTLLDMTA